MNTVTPVGIAVALAVVIALAFLFYGSAIFTPLSPASVPATLMNASSTDTSAAAFDPKSVDKNPTSLEGKDVVVGTGAEAAAGDTVTVDYVGALTDGTVFDASQNHGQPFSFTLGANQVIQGWDQGLVGMKEGGTRILVIPASMGYGAQANGPIPANSTLVFQVKLLKVQKAQ